MIIHGIVHKSSEIAGKSVLAACAGAAVSVYSAPPEMSADGKMITGEVITSTTADTLGRFSADIGDNAKVWVATKCGECCPWRIEERENCCSTDSPEPPEQTQDPHFAVSTFAELATLPADTYISVQVTNGVRKGHFVLDTEPDAALLTLDTLQGIYVTTDAGEVFRRQLDEGGTLYPEFFGAFGLPRVNNAELLPSDDALQAHLTMTKRMGVILSYKSGHQYKVTTTLPYGSPNGQREIKGIDGKNAKIIGSFSTPMVLADFTGAHGLETWVRDIQFYGDENAPPTVGILKARPDTGGDSISSGLCTMTNVKTTGVFSKCASVFLASEAVLLLNSEFGQKSLAGDGFYLGDENIYNLAPPECLYPIDLSSTSTVFQSDSSRVNVSDPAATGVGTIIDGWSDAIFSGALANHGNETDGILFWIRRSRDIDLQGVSFHSEHGVGVLLGDESGIDTLRGIKVQSPRFSPKSHVNIATHPTADHVRLDNCIFEANNSIDFTTGSTYGHTELKLFESIPQNPAYIKYGAGSTFEGLIKAIPMHTIDLPTIQTRVLGVVDYGGGELMLPPPQPVDIATDEITVTSLRPSLMMLLRPEAGTTDTISKINGGYMGQVLTLRNALNSSNITVDSNNFTRLEADVSLVGNKQALQLVCVSEGVWSAVN